NYLDCFVPISSGLAMTNEDEKLMSQYTSPDTLKKVEEMFMSCFPKSNPFPTFPSHLGKEIEAEANTRYFRNENFKI
ncbi:MAG: hypothetical protein ACE5K2_08590, partial [Candidatus Zixiibacteriota bacterium]